MSSFFVGHVGNNLYISRNDRCESFLLVWLVIRKPDIVVGKENHI